jgi:acyl-coenzyme A synthetase/AMP-(fatty) acid ligase
MQPAALRWLDTMPVNANGKLDRVALKAAKMFHVEQNPTGTNRNGPDA